MKNNDESPQPATDRVTKRDIQANKWYRLKSNPLKILISIYVFDLCKYLPLSIKNTIYRSLGVTIGSETTIAPHAQIDPFFPEKISIGDNTVIGWDTKILTHEAYPSEWHVGPVEIGDNVTLGHSSATRPGVTIGDGAIVAADSFVDRDVEPGEKVGGTPIQTL